MLNKSGKERVIFKLEKSNLSETKLLKVRIKSKSEVFFDKIEYLFIFLIFYFFTIFNSVFLDILLVFMLHQLKLTYNLYYLFLMYFSLVIRTLQFLSEHLLSI